uniref:C3H1-type domain-containing protein n=1 Tax=Glossina morsitans morsitans TaxID=37546 RepID=A0A1B0FKW6_GLOMM
METALARINQTSAKSDGNKPSHGRIPDIGNSMTELNVANINSSNNSSIEQMDKMDQQQQQQQPQQQQQQQQQQLKSLENSQFRFHAALTRTISTPQPQIKQHYQINNHQQQHQQSNQEQQTQTQSQQQNANVAIVMNRLIENLGNINLHRKIERTQSEPLPQQVNTSRYKTELCRPFEEAGECKYGEKCQFAHGYHELRNLQRHPNEQISPANSAFQTAFNYVNTPPESPNAPMSPVNTPPPALMLGHTPIYIKPATVTTLTNGNIGNGAAAAIAPPVKQLLQKSSSSPIAIIRTVGGATKPPAKVNSVSSLNGAVTAADEQRLPC